MEPTVAQHKAFEKSVKKHLTVLIYAVFDDLERIFDTPPSVTLQNYSNLIKPKADQYEGLTSRFSILEHVNQFIRIIFFQVIEEIKLATVVVINDTIDSINEKAAPNTLECMLSFVIALSRRHPAFGETLTAVRDETNWLHTQFVNFLPKEYLPLNVLVASFSSTFDTFLKCVAWAVGSIIWYTESRQVNEWLMLGVFTAIGMQPLLICDIQENIRVTPKKARKPAGGAGPAHDTPPNEVPPTVPPTADDEVNELLNMV